MKKLTDYWGRNFLVLEFIVVAVSAVGLWAVVRRDGYAGIDAVLLQRRSAIYSTLTTIHAALLGFVITTTAITLGFAGSSRFAFLEKTANYEELWKVFRANIRSFAVATIASAAALIIDREPPNQNRPATFIAAFATLWAFTRLARCTWVLRRVIEVVTKNRASHDEI